MNSVYHQFSYDELNRLTTARASNASDGTDPDRLYIQTYTYDEAGNMTEKTGKGGFKVKEWEGNFIRPAKVQFDREMRGIGERDITYDQDDKPTQITYNGTTSYVYYDGEGNRIKKVCGSETTIYVGEIYEMRNDQAIAHIFANGQRVLNGEKYFTHTDPLGSTRIVTDGNGNKV